MSGLVDVLVAANYAELCRAQRDYELSDARLVNASGRLSQLEGLRVRDIFVAPGAYRGTHIAQVMESLRASQVKSMGDDVRKVEYL